jgi:hypothetical protein
MNFTNSNPITNLGISVAASLLPLVVLGIPKITGVSHKVRSDSVRTNHLAQVAQYYKARACYRLEANQPLTRGDIIPHPVETACYEVTIGGQAMQLAYVVKDLETGLIRVASVFTPKELTNQLSILNQP